MKSGYGTAEVGLVAVEVMLQVYLLELYVTAGLDPVWAGVALALAVLWDAISDPLMGIVSDRTPAPSARGKRLPYLFAGALLGGLAFTQLFSPSAGGGQWQLFGELLLWYLVLNTAMTLSIVPYLALINDLGKRSQDRGGFFGWRLVFSGAGLIVGLSIPSLLAQQQGVEIETGDREALLANRSLASYWISGALLLFSCSAIAAVWKASGRAEPSEESLAGGSILEVWKTAFRSRGFLLIVGAFVFISMGRAINASLALIFYKGTLRFSDDQVAVALIGLSLVVMVATPFWVWLSKRFRKRSLCVWGSLALTALTATVYPLMPPEAIAPLAFIIVSGGIAASSVVLLEALFSDVVESDGSRMGRSLSGSYYGLWRMATKVARAGGLAVSGLFLGAIGYEEGAAEQSHQALRSVAWAFGPGVAFFFAIGTGLIWKEKVAAMKSEEVQ
ncbi:MFS transporter [Pelagicoccus sp. SDUM812003]|uniref:MFS transporter n=1 Tax=Pelagicoccus sp. SDUM812003 TaxID=3041267 RepID=UPI0028124035|nr:MFS transporter [Pelagicoccus sp. SDUM812003]